MDIGADGRVIHRVFGGDFYMDSLVSLMFETKYLDDTDWQEVDKLQGSPIVAYGPARNAFEPVKIKDLETRRFLDGGSVDSLLMHDIFMAFDAAIMLLLEQLPAKIGNFIPDPMNVLKNHIVDDCDNWSSSDGGYLIIGLMSNGKTYQLVLILPFEVLQDK